MTSPNILFVITDQQHIDSISTLGCPYVETPAMDQLVQSGISFSQSYCANPICGPSRASLFSGRPASEAGVPINNLPMRQGVPNMGQWFSEKTDYETLYSGKWHVPDSYTHFIPGFRVLQTGIGGQGNLGDTAASQAAAAFLKNRSKDRPFLLAASFLQPHDICEWLRLNANNPDSLPYPDLAEALPPLPDNFDYDPHEPAYVKRRRQEREPFRSDKPWQKEHWRYYFWSYYRHVEMVDAEIARLLQALKENGYWEDTLIVFTADHGEGMGHHQHVRKNVLYDEAAAVPFVAVWPGVLAAGRQDQTHLISGLDIFPTFCDFAGIAPPEAVRGQSLKPILEDEAAPWRDYLISEANKNQGRMVRSAQYKYITYAGDPVEQLFDMQADPGETRNLAENPDLTGVLKDHRTRLRTWEAQLDLAPDTPYTDAWWYEVKQT